MEDQSVSTVLSLSLHPSPGISRSREGKPRVDLYPSIWCFNIIEDDEEHPISATPNLQELTFRTLLPSSTPSDPSSALDHLPVAATYEEFDMILPSRLKGNGYWITKRLSLSDVNDSSRLLLPKEDVKKTILPLMDEERRAACQTTEGLRVKMWDLDTISEHELSFKQWNNGCFLLTTNWPVDFVRRRSLQEGDCIGLMWDFENIGFFFTKFNA